MSFKFNLVTPPAVEPISLGDLRDHLRLDDHSENPYLETLITAAREFLESRTWRAFITQTLQVKLDSFVESIRLSKPPLQSVMSITYLDTDGITQTADTSIYTVDTSAQPGEVRLAYGQSWPLVRGDHNCITIQYIAGYGDDPADVPEPLRLAVKHLAGFWWLNREATSKEQPEIVEHLLWMYTATEFV